MWILYALGSSFFAGVTAILAKAGIKKTDSNVATAIRTIIVLIFSWLMVWITHGFTPFSQINHQTIIILTLSGITTGASWLCYFKALQLGDVNKVVPIDKSSTILTIILALIFFQEGLDFKKIIALVFMSVGTLAMISKKETTTTSSNQKWLVYALLSSLFASATALLGKIGMQGIDSNLGTAIRTTVVLVMAWIMVFFTHHQHEIRYIDHKELLFICLSGLATGASWLCYYHALQDGLVSVVVAIDKLSMLFTIAFSFLFFHEKLSRKSFIGLIFILIGTLLLAL